MPPPIKKSVGYGTFPAAGPVREYRPLILAEAKRFSQLYYLDHRDVVFEALQIALAAEKKFDPKRGKFGTLLRWELRRLHRVCQREYRFRYDSRLMTGPAGWAPKEELDLRKAEKRQAREDRRNVRWRRDIPGFRALDADGNGNAPRNYTRWKRRVDAEEAVAAIDALRPSLSKPNEIAMAEWMAADIKGRESRTMVQAATDAGISKSYASKTVYRIALSLKIGNG